MSQLSDRFVEKADDYIGQSMDVKVLRVDARKNKAVFSRKAALSEEKKRAAEEIWSNLNVGDVVEGKVMRFTNYGAFVDIGGLDGLLHISFHGVSLFILKRFSRLVTSSTLRFLLSTRSRERFLLDTSSISQSHGHSLVQSTM